jgi:VCBS repeat-containing protein
MTLSVGNGALTLNGTAGLTFSQGDGTADADMTFTGTTTAINTALAGLTYRPNLNYNGADTLTVSTSDLGAFGLGGTLQDSDSVAITVQPVNDAPVNSVPASTQAAIEDTALVFNSANGNSITVADVDATTLELTLSVSHGALSLASTSGLSFGNGDGSADAAMTFSGSTAAVNAALAGLAYVGDNHINGSDTLVVLTSDLGASGAGGALTDSDSVSISVNAVNDAPVNSIQSATASVNEDENLTFSAAGNNAVSVNDVDAATVQVTLSVTHGVLTLNGTAGLTFSNGNGSANANMVFTGSQTSINAALNGLTYKGNLNFNGSDTLTLTTSDLGNSGSGGTLTDTDTVAITVDPVNDAPLNSVPTETQAVNEDTDLLFAEINANTISVSDIEGDTFTVTLTAGNGQLTLNSTNGLTFTSGDGNSNPTMTFTGSKQNVNFALSGLVYRGNLDYNGNDTITIQTSDLGASGSGGALSDSDVINVSVIPVNDAPVNTVPGMQTINEDIPLTFSSGNGNHISINDIEAVSVQVTLSVNYGKISLSGMTGLSFSNGDGVSDSLMTFSGTQLNVNSALDGLTYQGNPNFNGNDQLTITTSDLAGGGAAAVNMDTVIIKVLPVNDAPVNSVPTAQTINEDVNLVFSTTNNNSLSVSDVDATSVKITLAVTNGVLTLGSTGGLVFTNGDGASDASMTFSGTQTSVNSAIAGLIYRGNQNFNGNDTLTFTTDDMGSSGAGGSLIDADTVSITVSAVNDAPVNSVPAALQNVNEDEDLTFDSASNNAISVNDIEATQLQVTLAVTNGTLSLSGTAGLSFTGGTGLSNASMTFSGAKANVNAALSGLKYRGNLNFNGNETLTITTSDMGATGSGGTLTDVDSISILVAPVNDAPTNSLPTALQMVNEDENLNFTLGNSNAISVNDIEASTLQVTLAVNSGILILNGTSGLSFSSGNGTGSSTMTFSGSKSNINAALAGMIYRGNTNLNGSDTLTVTTSDLGSTGAGGILTDQDTISISVAAVNDAPVNIVSATSQSVDEDTNLVLSGNALSVSDVEASTLEVTLSVLNGTLTLSGTNNISFSNGDGSFDSTMTMTGSTAAINAALNGLTYRGNPEFNGTDTLTLTTSDMGGFGSGGTLTDTDTVTITVNAVNDAPVNTLGSISQSVNEDADLIFSSGSANLISTDDVEATTLRVTLSVLNGTLTLSNSSGLTFSNGDGSADSAMTFTGSKANVNSALNGLLYRATSHFNGSDTLTIVTSDMGSSGAGGALSDTDTVAIAVNAVNDAPVNTVSGPQSVKEDTNLSFSNANNNLISVSDVDASFVQVSLQVLNGTLTLSGTSGLTFSVGDGTSDQIMTFTATQTAANTALAGMTYRGTLNFNGSDTLSVTTSDLGGTGSGGTLTDSDSVAITVTPVNDAPVNTVPLAQTVNEDTNLIFSAANANALSVSDVEATNMMVSLSVENGTLSLGSTTGLSFTLGDGTNDASLSFIGTKADLNAALNGLVYRGNQNYFGPDTLTMSSFDQGASGSGGLMFDSDTVDITVVSVNDAPVNTAPATQSVNEDTNLTFSTANNNSISVFDVESSAVQVKLTVTQGSLTLAGISGLNFSSGNGTANSSMTFTGTQSNINAALNGLIYRGLTNYNGNDTLVIELSDLGNNGTSSVLTDTDSVSITVNPVNDAPVNSVPTAAQTVNEDENLTFTAAGGNPLSVSDIEASSLQVSLSVSNGSLTLSQTAGLAFSVGTGSSNSAMTFVGAKSDVNAALSGLVYRGNLNFNGSDTLTVTTSDQGATGSGGALTTTDTVSLSVSPVNDAPVNAVPTSQNTSEDSDIVFSSSNGNTISVADVEASNVQVTLQVDNGVLIPSASTGLTFTAGSGAGASLLTFTGSQANVNGALSGLTFHPNSNYNGSATLSIQTSDLGGAGSGGTLTDSDSISLTITPVNDAPVNAVPSSQSVNEDTDLVLSTSNGNAISVDDLDDSILQVSLTVSNGVLALSSTSGLTFLNGSSSPSSSMTFSGTKGNLNAALNGLKYRGNLNFNGAELLTIVTTDSGTSGAGGALNDTDTVALAVQAVNDAPVNTVPAAQTVNEDTDLVFSSANTISISDLEAGNVNVTLSVGSGSLTLSGTSGLTFSTGDGISDTAMSFTGTQSNINTALSGLIYRGSSNFNGNDILTITTSDLGATGLGGILTDTDTVGISVTAQNDAPVNVVPVAQSVLEDSNLIFSLGNGNSISTSDTEAVNLQVALSVTNGFLTLSGTSGLTFSSGTGSANSAMTFTGTQANVNAALNGLTYRGSLNFNGNSTLTITTSDLGSSGDGGIQTDTDTVAISVSAVNDPPINTVPSAQIVNEDSNLTFSLATSNRLSVNDVEATNLQVTLTVSNGALSLNGTSGLTFSNGDGTSDATMTFTGNKSDVNAALSGLIYRAQNDFNGPDTLSILTSDLGSDGAGGTLTDSDSIAITVNAVNDAPVNTVPASQSVNEDTNLTLNGISVTDTDAAALKVTLSVSNGALSLSSLTGLTFANGDGTSDATMTFSGSTGNVNSALNGLVYRGNTNFNGSDTLTLLTSDEGATGIGGTLTDSDTVSITVNAVNDAPVNTVPAAQTVNEDTNLTLNGISVADTDASSLKVTLSVSNGVLSLSSLSGLTFQSGDGTTDAAMTFSGAISNINVALNGLVYRGNSNYNGSDTLTVLTSDEGATGVGGTLTDTDTVAITVNAVNDAPMNTVAAAQAVNEETTLTFIAGANGISVDDVDANVLKVTLSVSSGVLTLSGTSGLTFQSGDGSSDSAMTFTGTKSDVNTALGGLVYLGNLNFNGNDTLVVTTSDEGSTGSGGLLTDIDTVGITVNAINDAPVNTVPASQAVSEDTNLTINGISVADTDAASLKVTLTVSNGMVTLNGTTGLTFASGDGTADSSMAFTGTISNLNTALSGLVYRGNANFNGSDTLTLLVSDEGATGAGGTLTDLDTVNILVDSVNNAPVNSVPAAQAVNEDTDLTFSSGVNGISADDVEASVLKVTLGVTHGVLTLSKTTGLAFTTGDGTADISLVFSGNKTDVNAALNGLVYRSDANFNGSDNLTIETSDLGASGLGGILTDTDTVAITVNAINDAPVNTVPPAQNVDEDVTLTFISGANGISVDDTDAGTLRVTLTVSNGVLSLSGTSGLTFQNGDGSSDAAMTFTGTKSALNTALAGLAYRGNANFNGSDTLTVLTSDLGSTGSGGTLTDSDTVVITVNPVNDAPVNTVPAAQTVNEDSNLTLNGISVSDVEATTLKVTVSANNGALSLSGITGLTFISGDGTNDATMTFSGATSNVNAALNALIYRGNSNYNGTDTLSVLTSDEGATGAGGTLTDSDTVAITVNAINDAPTLTSISTITGATEDTFKEILYADLAAAADEADVDSAAISFRIEAVSTGTLEKWNGSAWTPIVVGTTLISSGEKVQWQGAPDANGTLNAFTVKAYDGALASATAVQVSVAVAAVNDAPTMTSISTIAGAAEDTFKEILYSDLAAAADEADVENDPISFRIETVSTGTLEKWSGSAWTAVTAGTTLISSGEKVQWKGAQDANGTLNAFTVKAYDGALPSTTAVPVLVSVAAVNDAPTLTAITTLTGATEDTFKEILYTDLAAAADEADVDSAALSFRIEAVSTGTLEKWSGSAWSAVAAGTTLISSGDKVQWKAAQDANGTLNAFTVKAYDGALASATPVQVTVSVTAVNDVPTSTDDSISFNEDTSQALAVSDFGTYFDVETPALQLVKITSLPSASLGTIKLSGNNVTLNSFVTATQLTNGDLVFVPALNANGTTSLGFQVSDGTDTSLSIYTLTINVLPVNDNPTDITLSANSMNENMASASTVGNFTSTDVDAGNTFTYSLSGTDAASFSITGSTLKTAASFDFETKSSYAITLTTTDQGSLSFSKNFTITVNDINEAPTDVTLSATSINENMASGSTVGTLSSTDVDAGNTFTYSVGGTDAASFAISSGMLVTAAAFNYETKSSYSITVTTTDQGSLAFTKNFIITVNDVNEAPSDIILSATSINENMASGSTVGTLSSTDADAGNTFTYSLSGTDAASFSIVGNALKTAASFNFEAKSSYAITVTTTDQGSLTFSKNFTITVNDVNEAPIDITLSASSINENMPIASNVGSFASTDPDAGNTYTYSLSGADAASFSITGSTLKTAASFNFEAKSSYSITVTTTDQGSLALSKNFTITVNDVNEAPTDITLSATSINENMASGSTVGTFTSTDADAGNTFTYSLSGTDAASFSIVGDALKTAAGFNFEAKSSYAITVTTTDQGSLTFTKNFTITVNDVNEAPTDIALTATSINENMVSGSTVGTLSSTDADAGNTFTYSLSGTDAASFSITGSTLKTAASFNFEAKSSYAITVTTTDQGSLSFNKNFTITVNDVNEAPSDINLSAASINENMASGSTVGILSSTDVDAGNTFTYSVGGTDASSFAISSGMLVTTASFNYETKSSYSITVTTTDQGSLTFNKNFTITVNDVNEAPSDITLSATSINENMASGSTVGTLSSTDADAGNTFTYSLSGTDAASFSITGGTLKTAASFNFEAKSSYAITVTTTDQGSLTFTKNFTITVNDVNEAPTDIAISAASINENMTSGSTVATLSSTDSDAGNTFTYALSGTDAASFSITGNSLKTAASFNFEAKSSYAITVTTTDQGSLSFNKNFTITVNDINEAPTDITLSATSINENMASGSTLGTLSSTDVDAGNTFTYSVGGTDAASFAISSGMLVTAASFNYESKSSYSITLTTTDQGSLAFTKSFTISVNDVNEAPTDITLSATSINENMASASTVGTLSSTDADAGNTFTYSLSGTDAASFSIVGNALKTAASFNFEAKSSYAITVTTTDQGSLTFSKNFTITLNDVNEAPTDIALTATSINENVASGATVGTLSSTDVDAGSNFTYSLSGTDAASFSITGSTLKTAASFNFEAKGSYSITVTTTDQGSLTFNKNFTITVNDVNEAPTDITLSATSINENMASGSTVGTLASTDVDAGNTFTYSVGGADAASFTISSGMLVTAASFNYESKSSYSITLTTTDQGSLAFTKNFTISVNDVNEAPTDLILSATSINENLASASTVGTFASTDADAGNTFTYSLSGTDAASFSIVGDALKTAASFNFESKNSYAITVTTTDQGSLTFSKNFTITVNDVNEAPTDIALTASSINENVASGATVGTLSSTDVDAGSTFTYSLSGTDAASFSITGSTLKTAASFNFEAKNSYNITVTTTDQGSLTFTKNFTITVNDVNEAPSDITLSATSINENMASGSTVGTLSSTDADAGNTFTYSLSGTDAASFSITGSTLKTAASFNFESKSSYAITVTTTDQGSLTFTKNFTITVNDVNEAPTDIALSAASINENMTSGSTVGTLSSTDVDAGSTFTYSLSGTDAASFSITGSTLKTAASFNFEAKSSYAITVTTTDQGSLSFSKNFTITVNDINEAPTDVALSATSINENMASGSTVGTLSSTDVDAGNTFTYSVGGTDAASFAISSGMLVTTASFNYETKSSYSITLTTTDQGSLAFTKSFTISVNDVNEAPTDITLSATSINENLASGSTVGTLSSTDADAGNTFTYSLSGTDAASFSIVGNALKTAASFNFEAKSSYAITVTTTDQGALTFSKNFTITVNDVNEAPIDIALTATSINENVASGATVGTLSSTDVDAGSTFTYSLSGTDAASFSITGSTLKTAASFNFEAKSTYAITVTTTDQGSLTFNKNFTITVNDVNEAPIDITLSATSINENMASGATVGTLSSADVDAGSTFTYSLSGTDAASFSITGSSLQTAASFNYETKSSYSITVTTTDQGALTFTKNFTITVNDVNEAPTDIALSANSINENMASGSTVGTLSSTDADAGNTFTYVLSGTDAASFSITGSTLKTAASFNFEAKSSYAITVTTTDQGSLAFSKNFTITVNDLNEAPTDLILSASSINENLASASTVGTFASTDPDTGNTFTYSLSGTDAASFSMTGSTLQTAASFNFEAKSSYSITVTTTDQGSLTFNKNFTITVNDVNEAPTDITLSATSINENMASGSTVGTLSSTDADAGNTFTYSLSGTDAASFSITGSTLQTAASFNFESKSSYAITVTTTDQGSLTFTKNFTITVNDVNEAPTDIALSAASINENMTSGSTVGTLSSTDVDAGSNFTYSLSGTDAASFSITGSTLKTAASFNFEAKSSYAITVTTTDQGSLSFNKNFTITVNDINEAPTDVALSATSINENMASGSSVGTLSSTDVDAGNTFTYTVGGTDAASFAISSGMLVTTASFNYETKSSYSITLTTTDQGSLAFTKSFTISVNDVNEAPTDITLSAASINENMASASTVGTLSSTDVDAVSSFTYSLSGTDAASFSIVGNALKTAASFNFEAKNSYAITVTTTDQGSLTFSKNFTITVNDVNEAPTDIALTATSINENVSSGATVGTLSSTDVDAGSTFTYSLSGTDAASFSITGNSLQTAASFNYETKSSYAITVTTTDQGSLTSNKNFTITVNDVNEAPTDIALSANSINENMASGSTVGTLSSTDADAGNTFVYTVGGTDAASFSITGSTLKTAASFNFEAKGSYSITITSTDQGNQAYTKSFTISVNDINEKPILAGGDTSKITAEDTAASITLASATDPDAGNTMTYSIVTSPTNGTLGSLPSTPGAGGSLTYTPSANFNGSDSFTYTVCDNLNLCATSQTVTISITAVNDAPTISAVTGPTINEDTNTGALSFTIADIDSTVLCSQVTATSSNTTVIPNASLVLAGGGTTSCSITATPAANQNGSATITLSLTDSSSANTTRTFTVTVNPVNDTPTMNSISNQTVNMNNSINVSFTVGDIDGLSDISCSAANLSYSSSTTSIVPATGALSWSGTAPNCVGQITPTTSQFGVLNITFQIQDAAATTASRTFQLTVNDTRAATAPTITGAASVPSNVTNFNLSGTCTANYTVTLAGDVTATDIINPSQSLTQTCASNGTYSYTIQKLTDGGYLFQVSQINPLQVPSPVASGTVSQSWIRDTSVPDAPTLTEPTINPTESRSGNFTFVGTCEANATVNLSSTTVGQYAVSPAPSAATTCSSSGTFSIVQALGTAGSQTSGDGTYYYSLSQTDSANNTSSSITFTWTKNYLIPPTPQSSSPLNSGSSTSVTHYTTSSAVTTITITVSCVYVGAATGNNVTINENGSTVSTGNCLNTNTYTYTTTTHGTDGTYPFEIFQTDIAAGKDSSPLLLTWVRDTSVPAAPVFTNPSTSAITAPTNLYLAGTCETNTSVKIYIGGALETQTTCTNSKFSTSVIRTGALANYSVTAKQQDAAGNLSVASSTITWTQDPSSVPIPAITFPSGGAVTNNTSLLNLQGQCQPGYIITIAAGSGTTLLSSDITNPSGSFSQTCATDGSFSYTIAKTGSTASTTYNFNITQQITSGGTSSPAAPFAWTRDTVAPTVTITAGSGNPYSGTAYFTFSVQVGETLSAYKCSTDNVTFTTCASPYVYSFASATNPAASNNIGKQIWVKATDTAQNSGAASTLTWTPAIYNSSLIYHFENNGTNASSYNASVSSNLTVTGATYTNTTGGKFSRGLNLAATTDTATLNDNAILSTFLSTATVEFFIQTNSTNAGTIMAQQVSNTSGLSWAIKVGSAGGNKYNITFGGSVNGTSLTTVTGTGACILTKSNSAWQHIAVTFDKGSVVLYCNGTSGGSGTIGTAGSTRLFDSTGAFTIGGH